MPDSHGVYMVPAFVGLGAPYWDPEARGAIFGLTLDATGAHLARAALEAVAYQTPRPDRSDGARTGAAAPAALRVDGGMAANAWLCQFLADILRVPVERPQNLETTALGAAFLAGLATGVWDGLDALARTWDSAGRLRAGHGRRSTRDADRRLARSRREDADARLMTSEWMPREDSNLD